MNVDYLERVINLQDQMLERFSSVIELTLPSTQGELSGLLESYRQARHELYQDAAAEVLAAQDVETSRRRSVAQKLPFNIVETTGFHGAPLTEEMGWDDLMPPEQH